MQERFIKEYEQIKKTYNFRIWNEDAKAMFYLQNRTLKDDDKWIMQYSGYRDLNKHPIFLWDFLKNKDLDVITLVRFGDCYDKLNTGGFYGWYEEYSKNVEHVRYCHLNSVVGYSAYVIGNLFENPEILEKFDTVDLNERYLECNKIEISKE